MSASGIGPLIGESRQLEKTAAEIQGDRVLLADDDKIDEAVSQYHDWFGRCLDALPEGHEERFRSEYEGGFLGGKIKSFLQAPGDVSPFYNPDETSPLVPYWSHPFETAFHGPLLNQRQILTEARQQLEGAGSSSQDLVLLERICRNFSEFLAPLGDRSRGRDPIVVEDEYDVQDLIHGVLRLFFDDVRPEEYVPEYGGAKSRLDFLLKTERIVVETKMTRSGLGTKEVGEQLIIDIKRYQAHPDCGALVALVYDPEKKIKNRRALEQDLSGKHDGLSARVYVTQ